MTEQRGIDRRQFLRSGALAGLSVGLLPWSASAAAETPGIQRQVRLGRTDLRVSDIGFGSSRLKGDEALVHHALERGITYFDTAAGYTGGRSEETLGRALQGRRDGVSLVSKVKTTPTSRRDDLMQALEGSLRRLRTDRLDVYFSHAVNDVARLQNAEWPEFLGRAREQGKIRFAGLSGHGGRLVECLDFALDHDLVDVVLVAYNFGQDPAFYERLTGRFDFVARQPDLPRVLARARQQDVGVVAMKTLMGAKLNDLGPYQMGGASFAQAAFRWVLSSPHVDSLIVTMKTPAAIDDYVGASGWTPPGPQDVGLLRQHLEGRGHEQCRYGCSACADACPHLVSIPDVLRSRMYLEDYADPELAADTYARLDSRAAACLDCSSRACLAACPYGIPISDLTQRVHRALA
jgi:predicted aldo/keto reductase-like oxidoreductase